MATWDESKAMLSLKIVFYGPALSGKTTNLISLHDIIQPELKGDMQILETKDDRTLYFDLLPVGIRLKDGTLIKLKLYTVPGQVVHNSTRKAVLSRTDGIIFVADSQVTQSENNAESFDNLIQNTQQLGIELEKLPLIVQFNKRDLINIVSTEELEQRWNKSPWQLVYASAINKKGVFETFTELLKLVYLRINEEYSLEEKYSLSQLSFIQQIIGDPV